MLPSKTRTVVSRIAGVLALALFGCWTAPAAFASPKKHPTLVSAGSARCEICHKALFQGRAHVHPATEDCTSCHDMVVAESGTTVDFVAETPDLCVACHDDKTSAAEMELEAPHAPVADCLACHEPHASEQERLLSAPVNELCTGCHDIDDLKPVHQGQISGSVSCTRCHQPHGSNTAKMLAAANQHPPFAERSCDACHRPPFAGRIRLAARGERLCTACHGDIAEPPEGGSLHPALLAQGRSRGCTACHDPHMSPRQRLLVKDTQALCRDCHPRIVAAAVAETGHPPAGEDCRACHEPHTSGSPRLLDAAPSEVCRSCHDAEDADLRATHLGADLGSLECLSCHDPHGSGNPKLLAHYVHPPVLDGCPVCHEGASDKLTADGESELCLACHGDIEQVIADAQYPHGALELVACKQCHNPHASPQQRLVKLPSGGECIECHSDQAAEAGEVSHGAIGLVGCRSCHEPHGGEREKLLRKAGNALCLDCHGAHSWPEGADPVTLAGRFEVPRAAAEAIPVLRLDPEGTRGHPVPGHPVAGTITPGHSRREITFEGELGCLTCHDPHKGRSQGLFRDGIDSAVGACLKCHPK